MYLQMSEQKPGIEQFYIPFPTGNGTHKLIREDILDDLSDNEWNDYMDALEMAGMSGLFGSKEKRAARQKAREERKAAKTEIKTAKAQAIKDGTYKGGFAGVVDTIGGAIAKATGKTPGTGGGLEFEASYGTEPEKKPPYALYIGGAVAVLIVAAVLISKSKKRK